MFGAKKSRSTAQPSSPPPPSEPPELPPSDPLEPEPESEDVTVVTEAELSSEPEVDPDVPFPPLEPSRPEEEEESRPELLEPGPEDALPPSPPWPSVEFSATATAVVSSEPSWRLPLELSPDEPLRSPDSREPPSRPRERSPVKLRSTNRARSSTGATATAAGAETPCA